MARDSPSSIPDPGVSQGDILAGKYEVLTVLGVGGMGIVVAARHLQLGVKVALKFLMPAMLDHPEALARFSTESAVALKITSEHVPHVLDVGTLESGAPYIVMEFLEGEDLASLLQRQGPLPVHGAVEFILQACVAVADAHALGIVHRDLKPSNLFWVTRSDGLPLVKVLDFGISKMTDSRLSGPASSVTRTGVAMGSPAYASPEQLRSARDVDARTDIWSLGATLYELLTGTAPFTGGGAVEVAIKVAADEPAPLEQLRSDLPVGLSQVVVRCLRKDAGDRYADVAELARALAPFGTRRATDFADRIAGILHAAGITTTAPSTRAAPSSLTPVSAESWPKVVRSRHFQAAGALVALALATTAVLLLRPVASQSEAGAVAAATSSGTIAVEPPPSVVERSEIRIIESAAVPPAARLLPSRSAWNRSPNALGSAAAPSASPARAALALNCSPNFTIDEQGRKHFKRECFTK